MLWLLFSFIFYAFNNVVWKWTVHDEHPVYLISRRAIFTFLFAVIFVFVQQTQPFSFVFQPQFYLIVIGCMFGTIGLILMINFLKNGSLTRLSYYMFLGMAINGSYTYYVEKIAFTANIVLGTIVLLLGYTGFIYDEQRKIKKERVLISQHLLLFGMTICFSISSLIMWNVLKNFQPSAIMVTQEFMVLIVTTLLYLFIKTPKRQATLKSYALFPLMALVIMLAVFTGLMGLKVTNPFISTLGGVATPLLTLLFGSLFFKEKLNLIQMASFAVIVVGEVILF